MHSLAVDIRPLTPGDAATYQALRLAGLLESPDAFGSTHAEDVALSLAAVADRLTPGNAEAPKIVLGAFIADELAGVVTCVRELKLKSRHKAVILGMYVSPSARGRGVGRLLVERAIDEARGWPGVERITLTVVTRASAARRLYHRVGFRPFGLELDAMRQGDDRLDIEYLSFDLAT